MLKYVILLIYFLSSFAFASYSQLIIEPQDGRKPILEAIHHAQSSIDLAIYGFTDPVLMQALIQAKQEGKKIRILLQHFPYKAMNENLPAIQYFSKNHLNYAFTPPAFYFLHQKTLIIDHRLALVMTFNFTRSTFKNQRNFGVIVTDPALVTEIQQVFDADWQHQSINPHQSALVWSPDNSRSKILNAINSAKTEIKIYTQSLNDYRIVGALAKAARQGIIVQVLMSGAMSSGKQDYLRRAGVQLHINKHLVIHAKLMLIDQQKALLGSINFTQTSLDKNRELSLWVTAPSLVKVLLMVFQQDWGEIPVNTNRLIFKRVQQLLVYPIKS